MAAMISRRRLRVFYLNLVKQSGTPESISRGVAVGFFTGFVVPFGLQMVAAVILAFVLKARKIPALACTWVTNPWTVPFIYPFQCLLGAKLSGGELGWKTANDLFGTFLKERTFESFTNLGTEILVPFFVGGVFLGLLFALCSYFASYGMIISYGKRVEAKLARRLARQSVKSD
ncbi:MAG: DUF2062 domain-containing protein [Victivallales bacterium]|nr:DUF2062 domain-containing protein [Victivallales bacterium]